MKWVVGSSFVLAMLLGSVLVVNQSSEVKALGASDFVAGNIMSDNVMTNKDSMSVGQIQVFLNGKVPVCDTNGTQISEFGGGTRAQWAAARGYSPPFTCLKDFSENGKTSAQIIYDAAQEFSINPQVLIVLLQKEQALVTDTWPIPGSSQYRTATGYGCPDTAACDSQYFGLTNQLRWSARMFRAILNNSPTWYTPYLLGNNFVQFNPNASCGGSNVNIQNRTTQALYNYTPYQPNQAVLNWKFNGGTSPTSCGAYGNLNFFVFFREWFGSTQLRNNGKTVNYTVFDATSDTTGKSAKIGFMLAKQPSSDVVLTFALNKPSTGEIEQASLTITRSTWNRPDLNLQRIFGRDDGSQEGSRQYTLRIISIKSNDADFNSINPSSIGSVQLSNISYRTGDGRVFRLYNSDSMRHFYTSNTEERDNLVNQNGWVLEGTAFYMCRSGTLSISRYTDGQNWFLGRSLPSEYKETYSLHSVAFASENQNKASRAVYWLINQNTGNNFYTTNSQEADTATTNNFINKGVAFYVCEPDSRPIHRLFNRDTGNHLFTRNTAERNTAIRSLDFIDEGVAFYVCNTDGDQQVYRLYNDRTKRHFYTQSIAERDIIDQSTNFKYEGVGFTSCSDDRTVTRLYNRNIEKHFYSVTQSEIDVLSQNFDYVIEGISFNVR